MPQLPTAQDLGARPLPQPVTGSLPSGASEAAGAGIAQAGRSLSSGANDLQRMVEEQTAQANTLRTEDAQNQLQAAVQDLSSGDSGFEHVHGTDATTQPLLNNYTGKFNEAAKKIESGLANDEQRAMFRRRAAVVGLQYRNDLISHIGREGEAASAQVYKSTLETEVQNAGVHYLQPDAVNASALRLANAVQVRADHAGWDDKTKALEYAGVMSSLHREVINGALTAQNYLYAKQYFDTNKAQMTEQDRKALEAPMMLATSQFMAQDIIAKFGTSNRAYVEADKIRDPVLGKNVRDAIDHRVASENARQELVDKNLRMAVSQAIETSDPSQPAAVVLPPGLVSQMVKQPNLMGWAEKRQRERLTGEEPKSDNLAIHELETALANGTRVDMTKYLFRLTPGMYKDYEEKFNNPKKRQEAEIDALDFNDIAFKSGDAKLNPYDSAKSTNEKAAIGSVQVQVNQKLTALQQTQKEPLSTEQKRDIMQKAIDAKIMDPHWYGDAAVREMLATPEQLGGGYVMVGPTKVNLIDIPPQERARIIAAKEAAGEQVTEQSIAEAWVAQKGQVDGGLINSEAEYNALPHGALYKKADGKTYRKQ